jgi:glycosyltransferase involved in cell wall biosynthesis
MNQPLISVVCLCFNHQRFVGEAIHSVLNQTYTNIELIVVDDCSTDASVSIIDQTIKDHPNVTFLKLEENLGICAAFNRGLALAKGDFITDFAADDVMLPQRMERLMDHFSRLGPSYGVVFSNSVYIDAIGRNLRYHTEYLKKKKLISEVPEGWIFRDVLRRYFISAPSTLVRREVFNTLTGYVENLAYEDFDFWVRSARNYKFGYLDEVLTKVRRTRRSMSSGWYELGDKQLHSTFLVCQKAVELCLDEEDKRALLTRVRYEFKQAIFSGNKDEANLFGELEQRIKSRSWQSHLFSILASLPLPWPWIRKKYHRLFYG